jgi:acetyltransferase-like isoleucine patch superfamily enzyme
MYADIQRAWGILGRLNALAPGDFDVVRALLGELTGHELDSSVRVLPPFHTDGGRNLRFGRNVFVNHGCTAMDLGGIDIGDDVMIGPNVHLISSGHPLDPATAARRSRLPRSASAAACGSRQAPWSCRASRLATTPW